MIDLRTNRDRSDSPLAIAHRGASGFAPENTGAAFALAAALGAHGIELDVQLSADDVPVVIHDTRLDRTTDATGRVDRLTADQLQDLDAGTWFDRRLAVRPRSRAAAERAAALANRTSARFAGEPIPMLADVLRSLTASPLRRIYVEFKSGSRQVETLVSETVRQVVASAVADRVTFLSFDHSAIVLAGRLAPQVRRAATFPVAGRRMWSAQGITAAARQAGVDEVALHVGLVTRRRVFAMHQEGLSVSTWTANSPLLMRRLIACGVDVIMTNYPDRLLKLIESAEPGEHPPDSGARR